MRYVYACFKGYIGFYNGMGLDKLEIDFTKCRNDIIMISGKNGSGKSTLMNALHPFPDPSHAFVPNMNAEKILTLFNEGDTYDIKIVSLSDTKGGRKTTKAFIRKNGLELNENGNVTSYKEIIFSEFDLDANYIALTKLSSNDRGLGDKTPAERKKFVSSIINNLEVYNDIYTTLNKRSLVFKSHINNLHTKIQNIGDKNNLQMTLDSLQKQSQTISTTIMQLNNRIVELETRASINQEEAVKISNLKTEMEDLIQKMSTIDADIRIYQKNTKVLPEDVTDKLSQESQLHQKYCKDLEGVKLEWITESGRLSSTYNSITEMKSTLEAYKSNIDDSMEDRYNAMVSYLNNTRKNISAKLEIPLENFDVNFHINNISRLIEFYEKFIRLIDIFYDGLDLKDIEKIISFSEETVEAINNRKKFLEDEIFSNNVSIKAYSRAIDLLDQLSLRPDGCKFNNCPYISEAVETQKLYENIDLVDIINECRKKIEENNKELDHIKELSPKLSLYRNKKFELNRIIADIEEILPLLAMYKDLDLSSIDKFLYLLSNNYSFNPQREPRKFIDILNELKELESEENLFMLLEIERKNNNDKIAMISKTEDSIKKMENEIAIISDNVSELKSRKDGLEGLVDSLSSRIISLTDYSVKVINRNGLNKKIEEIKSIIDNFQSKDSQSILEITRCKSEIDSLNSKLQPISIEINRLSGQLTMLDSYYEEYTMYKEKFTTINTLKKYCSPTGGGIQTIFMTLYMGKTLELANQVLSMLFGGEYQLLDFVINANEFRIPFIGSGLAVDDISSGSNSQICIMGMAINLVLSHQASTKFNIAQLDEISESLDNRNRIDFIKALYYCKQILNIEQLFIIAHAMEMDSSTVDIIRLKSYDGYEGENVQMGNIIWDYSEEIKKTLQ